MGKVTYQGLVPPDDPMFSGGPEMFSPLVSSTTSASDSRHTMDSRVAKLKSPAECEAFAQNARERGAPELADQARKRAVQLRALSHGATTEVERECLEAVYAYEEVLSANRGKRQSASRTWQMIHRHGVLPAVELIVIKRAESVGYTALAEMGLLDLAFEAVVLRHPECFSAEAITRSRERLESHNGG